MGDELWQHGDEAENFYFILRGRVEIQHRNFNVNEWSWAYKMYHLHKKWLKKQFETRVQNQMQIELIKLNLESDVK